MTVSQAWWACTACRCHLLRCHDIKHGDESVEEQMNRHRKNCVPWAGFELQHIYDGERQVPRTLE